MSDENAPEKQKEPQSKISRPIWDASHHIFSPDAIQLKRALKQTKARKKLQQVAEQKFHDFVSRSRSLSPPRSARNAKARYSSQSRTSRDASKRREFAKSHKKIVSRNAARSGRHPPNSHRKPVHHATQKLNISSSSDSSETFPYSDAEHDLPQNRQRSRKQTNSKKSQNNKGKKRKRKSKKRKTRPSAPSLSPKSDSETPPPQKKRRKQARQKSDSLSTRSPHSDSSSMSPDHSADLKQMLRRTHRRERELQKKLKLPARPEKQRLITTTYDSLLRDIESIPHMSEDAIDLRLRIFRPGNISEQKVLVRARDTSDFQGKKIV